MHHAQDARAAVAAASRHEIPQCSRRLTAAVLDWRTRLENGEDCAVLQVEILRFAQGDRDVLRELIEIAQLYEQRDSAPVLPSRRPRHRTRRSGGRYTDWAANGSAVRHLRPLAN